MGSLFHPLTEQIASTMQVHGFAWTQWHYTTNRRGPKVPAWEFFILSRGAMQ